MSASDALTIWMLSTAMKAPSVAPNTAIQVRVDTAGAAAVCGRSLGVLGGPAALVGGCSAVMDVSCQLNASAQPPFGRASATSAASRLLASRSATTVALVSTVGSAD